jgi:hypothetical protein
LKRSDGPWLGLYLWARFDRAPAPSKPYPRLPEQVIYVGETKHLDARPLTGEHHRLVHYRETFRDDPGLERLYVSVCRVHRFQNGYERDDARVLYARLRVYTQYIEARLYWFYTKRWGHPPALHYKKSAKDDDAT